MDYRVLGPVELLADGGTQIRVGGDRQLALLAALVARSREVVSIDALAELLWGDNQPEQPANAVQVLVSRIRGAVRGVGIEFDDLQTRAPGYVLNADVNRVDAGVFEQLVAEAAESGPEEAPGIIQRALSMWRGRAYAEFADVEIARLEALRLEELRRSATVSLGGALVAADRADEALAVLEPFVVEHPLREGARAGLMRAMYAQGRHAEALAVYQDYRTVLADELGLEPSGALQQLELDILRHDLPDASPPRRRGTPPRLSDMTVRYLAEDMVAVAWAKVGSGPRLVVVPAWVASLDVMSSGRDPRSSVLDRMAAHTELTLYDRRGTGLTGGAVDDFSVEAGVSELEMVIEATGGSGALFAMSQAGPTAIVAAARRPDLVSSLILFGTYASGSHTFTNQPLVDAILEMIHSHWGVGSRLLAGLYRPDASDTAAEHLGRVLRDSAPRDVAAGYLESVYATDVTEVLGDVRCPTLVIHYRNDRVIPFAGGKQLAAAIANAEFLALDGPYHLPDAADLDRIVNAIAGFLVGLAQTAQVDPD